MILSYAWRGAVIHLTLQQYLDSLAGKRIAVLGIGVSNTPLIRLLREAGLDVTARDKAERASFDGGRLEELEALGAKLVLGQGYLDGLTQYDVIFRTPGMRPDLPQLEAARAAGAEITSEMEVFFRVCPATLIAVTGSDGKTTTTTIIAGLLTLAGYRTYVGGNIGNPLLAQAGEMRSDDFAVLELSSFQLMTMTQSPHIAVVTNLAPNHLDVHRSMDEYVDAKRNIVRFQSAADRAVLNLDNDIAKNFAADTPAQVSFFSFRSEPEEDGAFLRDNAVWLKDSGGEHRVLHRRDILLPGDHNVENYMAAIAAVRDFVPTHVILEYAKTFGGVEHRIELVRELDGVRWYNDSIASSPSRTIAGLRSFKEKVILIAGGYDKHIPYDVLGPELVEHVKYLFLTGDTAPKIREAAEGAPGYTPGYPEIVDCADLQEAVEAARRTARKGDVVILSPASASFDRFKNFMERGNVFKELVRGL